MNHKIMKYFLLFFILIILSLGAVYASDSSDNITSTINKDNEIDSSTISIENSNDNNVVESKEISNKNKNLKKEMVKVSSYGELEEKIEDLNEWGDGNNTISLKNGYYRATSILEWGEYRRPKTLTIDGNGSTLDGLNENRFIEIKPSSTLILKNIVLTNFTTRTLYMGTYSDNGACILTSRNNTVILINSTFKDNYATEEGSALFINNSNLEIKECKFINNNAHKKGGAISISNDNTYNFTSVISDSVFINNKVDSSGGYGGAIYGCDKIINSTFNNNHADEGGALYDVNNVTLSTFIKNHANQGSAIYSTDSIINSTFTNNTALWSGTIKYADLVKNSRFTNNKAQYGGAIHSVREIRNSIFDKNKAEEGGALVNAYNLYNNTFRNNVATNIGGVIAITESEEWMDNAGYIKNNTFVNNTALYGGVLFNIESGRKIVNNNFINNSATDGGAIFNGYQKAIEEYDITNPANNVNIYNNTFLGNKATQNGAAIYNNNSVNVKIRLNIFQNNTSKTLNPTIVNTGTITYKNNTNETKSHTSTIYNSGKNMKIESNIFDRGKQLDTKITITTVKSIVGEKLTFKANILDENNKKVTNGYVIFKLNGITIKDNGKLTDSKNNLKVYVSNGVASTTVTADLNMRNAKTLTAVYSGSTSYYASRSNNVSAQIALRNASIVVSSNLKTIKQGQIITLNAKIYDITKGKRNINLIKYEDEYVYFKVNGITLKNSTGNTLKVKVVNATATTKYKIPLGLSGITDGRTMKIKNHTILAGYINKNYYPTAKNTSTFQVERSNITINIQKVNINNLTHKMNITGTIKDYLGNNVIGPNKLAIKVNKVTIKDSKNKTQYIKVQNGKINITNLNIPSYNKYNSIEIVTQDRLAYKSQRNTTTKINIIEENAHIQISSAQTLPYNDLVNFYIDTYDDHYNTITSGKINWYLNFKLINTTNIQNGHSEIFIKNQNTGKYTVKAELNKANYKKVSASTNLTITKLNSTVNILSQGAVKGSNILLRALVYDNYYNEVNEGNITFYIDNKNVGTTSLHNGIAKLPITITQSSGIHNIYAKHTSPNHNNINNYQQEFIIEDNKINLETIAHNQLATPNTNIQEKIEIIDSYQNSINEGTVTAKLNGKRLGTYNIKNGYITINIGQKTKGTYNLSLEIKSKHYNTQNISCLIIVKDKINTEVTRVTGDGAPYAYGLKQGQYLTDNIFIIEKNTEDDSTLITNGKVKVSIDGKEVYTSTTINEFAETFFQEGYFASKIYFHIPLELGEHTIRFTYIPPNNTYTTSYFETKFKVLTEHEYQQLFDN